MTAEPSIVTNQETYLGYEILVATAGPIKTKLDEPEDEQTHYKAKVSIWFEGKEVKEAGEVPSTFYASREEAEASGFAIGRRNLTQCR